MATQYGPDRDSGYVDYSSGGTSKFIPQFWAGKLITKFYGTTAFGEICNTDYQGDISDMGDSVVINADPDIDIKDYKIGQTLTSEQPESTAQILNIDKAKYFSFELDDVDQYQAKPDLMDRFSGVASHKMAAKIDADVCGNIYLDVDSANKGDSAGADSGDIDLGKSGTPKAIGPDNAVDFLVDLNTVMDEQDVEEENRWVLLPPWFCAFIKKGDIQNASITGDSTGVIRNGRIGEIDGLRIYKNRHLAVDTTDKATSIIAGHKAGVTFASQMTRLEHKDNPNKFGQLLHGLNVYGYKVIEPKYLVHGYVSKK